MTQGRDAAEAARRRDSHGANQIETTKGKSPGQILLAQLANFLLVILMISGATSGATGHWIDAIAIVIVALNTAVSLWQEFSAERPMAA